MSMVSEQIKALRDVAQAYSHNGLGMILKQAADTIEELSAKLASANMERSTAHYNDGWIPFTEKEADEEEKEAYGCDYMLSCKLPEEDVEILVTYKNGYVDTDTFMRNGYECYLDSGAEFITQAIAWMPKPKGYKPKGE